MSRISETTFINVYIYRNTLFLNSFNRKTEAQRSFVPVYKLVTLFQYTGERQLHASS